MIKNITVGEFSAKAHMMVGDVLAGDIIRVDCDEAGAFLLVDEEQYNALRDAAGLLMTGQAKIEKPADDERRANEV